jgi:hypothetical protein
LVPRRPPAISIARLAITSLTFMLVCVPLPVCHTTSGNSPSRSPSTTSSATAAIRRALSSGRSPRSRLTSAEAFLIAASAWTISRGMRSSPIRKFWSERWVWAPQ